MFEGLYVKISNDTRNGTIAFIVTWKLLTKRIPQIKIRHQLFIDQKTATFSVVGCSL